MELIIAEKPSVAKAIAALLNVPIDKGRYFQNNRYCISWCYGHLIELAQPQIYDAAYKEWKLEHLPIIPDPFLHEVKQGKEGTKSIQYQQFMAIKDLMHRADIDVIVCATDADREGELIYRRIHNMAKCRKPVKRMWIKSMENEGLQEAYRNAKNASFYDNTYYASMCRGFSDWLIGINGSRLMSILYQKKLSLGRVQTPTLGFVVDRDRQIENFVKQLYYTVSLNAGGIEATGGRIDDVNEAKRIQALTNNKNATITNVEKSEKNNNPPKLYHLTGLQKDANQLFGYTADDTLKLVQSLYERKLMTYPRTDCQYITADMETAVKSLVGIVRGTLPFIKEPHPPIEMNRVIDNKKVTSHTAILPTKEIQNAKTLEGLSQEQMNILQLVSTRLLCAVAQPQRYLETIVTMESEGYPAYPFTAKGKVILSQGWKEIDNKYRSALKVTGEVTDKEKELPNVKKGEMYHGQTEIKDHVTSPPKPYTEATLLAAMETAGNEFIEEDIEKKGIGTEATRAAIIERLVYMQMLERKGKKIISTAKGRTLIDVVPESVKSPKMTAEWEDRLYQIEKGQLSADEFMKSIKAYTQQLITDNKVVKQDVSFANTQEVIGKCPRCGANVYENAKYKSFFCSNKECKFILWEDARFFKEKKKKITKKMAKDFLLKGSSNVTGLYSPKKDKKYDAVVVMKEVDKGDGSGEKWVNFELDFSQKTGKKSSRASKSRRAAK